MTVQLMRRTFRFGRSFLFSAITTHQQKNKIKQQQHNQNGKKGLHRPKYYMGFIQRTLVR